MYFSDHFDLQTKSCTLKGGGRGLTKRKKLEMSSVILFKQVVKAQEDNCFDGLSPASE